MSSDNEPSSAGSPGGAVRTVVWAIVLVNLMDPTNFGQCGFDITLFAYPAPAPLESMQTGGGLFLLGVVACVDIG